MIRRLIASLFAAAAALSVSAQTETTELALRDFSKVKASYGQVVRFSQSESYAVSVEIVRGELEDLTVSVDNGWLVIKPESKTGFARGPQAVVTVSAPSLEAIDVSSGASFSGARIDADSLTIEAVSGALVDLSGRCGRLSVDTSSGSTVSAAALTCEHAVIDVASGADVYVHAEASVEAEATSGASLIISGGAEDITQTSRSGASIEVANDPA